MRANVNSPGYVLVFTAALAVVFTAGITALQVATAPRVRRNEALREERALVSVFGLGDAGRMSPSEVAATVRLRVERAPAVRDPATGRAFDLFHAHAPGAEGAVEAVAFRFAGTGFWARISGLMALTPDLAKVTGMVILEQAETPGLGGRITEAEWLAKFKGITVSPPAEGAKFIYIGGGAPSSPQDPRWGRYVDAITGATQTSLAMGRFLDENLRQFHRAMRAATLGQVRETASSTTTTRPTTTTREGQD